MYKNNIIAMLLSCLVSGIYAAEPMVGQGLQVDQPTMIDMAQLGGAVTWYDGNLLCAKKWGDRVAVDVLCGKWSAKDFKVKANSESTFQWHPKQPYLLVDQIDSKSVIFVDTGEDMNFGYTQ